VDRRPSVDKVLESVTWWLMLVTVRLATVDLRLRGII
jgi:hypothetical protein